MPHLQTIQWELIMKLLVLDVEGTIFQSKVRLPGTSIDSTIWQSIAHTLGPKAVEEEIQTHKKWETGGYKNYLEWMEETILIHKKYGLKGERFWNLIQVAEYSPGACEILPSIDRQRFELVLISGGFRELAARAQQELDIKHAFAACEYFFGDDDLIEGYNLLPCDYEGKIDFIKLMVREYQLDDDDWIFVGDGKNDVSIAKEAPISIGYNPHPDLDKVVTYKIHHFRELPEILGEVE